MRLIDADALLKRITINSSGKRIPEVDCDNFPITLTIREIKEIIRNEPAVCADNEGI